jgi:threonine dehydratase
MIPPEWIHQARERIQAHIRSTPLTFYPDRNIYVKWENRQITGSFKLRGALNKVLSLQPWERERGLVAASAGNHGAGLALAGQITGAPVTVFVPENASSLKVDLIQKMNAEVVRVPGGYGEAEQAGLEFAQANQRTWVSPYNDGQIIAGQASIALEILPELPEAETYTWIVPCGGGGLISGIATALRSQAGTRTTHRVIGVQSEASPFMHALYHRQSQEGIQDAPSLADGLSGPVEKDSLTIPIIHSTVNEFLLVSEEEIINALRFVWDRYGEVIEPSAATVFAVILSGKALSTPAILIVSGGNINLEIHQNLIGNR